MTLNFKKYCERLRTYLTEEVKNREEDSVRSRFEAETKNHRMEVMTSRQNIKPPTYDKQTSWMTGARLKSAIKNSSAGCLHIHVVSRDQYQNTRTIHSVATTLTTTFQEQLVMHHLI